MLVKLPKDLIFFFFKKQDYTVMQLINKYGVIKKKIRHKNFNIIKFKKSLSLINLNYIKVLNNILILKIFFKNLMFNLFKIFKDRLVLEGVGYKVWKKLNVLKFKIGFSKPIYMKIPKGILVSLYKYKKITISSICLIHLRNFKYSLRSLKVPDCYKKKGIRFYKEIIKLKQGKRNK